MTDSSHILDENQHGRSFLSIDAMPEKELATLDIPFGDLEAERRRAMILDMSEAIDAVNDKAFIMASHFCRMITRLPPVWRDVVCYRLQGMKLKDIAVQLLNDDRQRVHRRARSPQRIESIIKQAMRRCVDVEILFTSKRVKAQNRRREKGANP